jgi:hypothetical protein
MRYGLFIGLLILPLLYTLGCQREPVADDASILMTAGQRELRQDEFMRAYRVFKTAYGTEPEDDPSLEKASIIRFIQQMAEQMVLLAYAQDIGVEVSPEALDRAVDEIRGDYPDDMFEQMLLENAVNLEDWKDTLRMRLTIDKLVEQELESKIQITEEDIADYYERHGSQTPPLNNEKEAAEPIDQLLVQQIRREKTELAYTPWIEQLKARYPVKIDEAVAQQIIADNMGT